MSSLMQLEIPLVTRRTRAYFAPVNRQTGAPSLFDPAANSDWQVHAPIAPWVDLGWVTEFSRSALGTFNTVYTGVPQTLSRQSRQIVGAEVSFRFQSWTKLSMGLSSGSQHMNLLAVAQTGTPSGSGGPAVSATPLGSNSTSTVLFPTVSGSNFGVGDLVVVDEDYEQQSGYVGAALSAGYVVSPGAVNGGTDYIRRVSYNVARIAALTQDGGLALASSLLAGTPGKSMKMQKITGFVDREGGSFFQEWSALFVSEGVQGERLFLHYPRLQAKQSSKEALVSIGSSLNLVALEASFVALPVVDANDGEQIVCYRAYIPAAMAKI